MFSIWNKMNITVSIALTSLGLGVGKHLLPLHVCDTEWSRKRG